MFKLGHVSSQVNAISAAQTNFNTTICNGNGLNLPHLLYRLFRGIFYVFRRLTTVPYESFCFTRSYELRRNCRNEVTCIRKGPGEKLIHTVSPYIPDNMRGKPRAKAISMLDITMAPTLNCLARFFTKSLGSTSIIKSRFRLGTK